LFIDGADLEWREFGPAEQRPVPLLGMLVTLYTCRLPLHATGVLD
jgi:hypothetical protein